MANLPDEIRRNPVVGARRLVAEYRDRLYYVAYRLCRNAADAEDLTFRTLQRAIERISSCRTDRNFFQWLYSILTNFRRMDVRLKAANMLEFTDELPDYPDSRPDAAETLAAAQGAAAVRQAVDALPDVFREVVVYRYFEDLTVPEIAQVLNIPEGSVKSRLSRAKEHIRRHLSGTIRADDAFNRNGDET
jgi:RNA polymerase sigma-70 factor (ECF subfamily)